MALQTIDMSIIGVAPLLMHSARLADPLDDYAKALKQISSKRKKTEADLLQMAEIEFKGSLYLNDEGHPILPDEMIEAVLINGAKKIKRGPDAKAGIFCPDHAILEYDGPKDAGELWSNKTFVSRTSVKVQNNRIMRTRPKFPKWACLFSLEFDDEVVSENDVIEFAEYAGRLVGFGDWRPRYGRFAVN